MKKFLTLLPALLLLAVVSAGAQVTAGATASAFDYQGSWTVGTEQTQQIPFIYAGAQKGNIFSLGTREVFDPGVFNMYGGLVNFQPDLSALFKNTTFNPDQVAISFDIAGGVATLQSGTTVPAVEGRINFQVALTPNASFTGGYAGGGLLGKNRFGDFSAGIAYAFGGPKTPVSLAKARFNSKYALKHPQ